MTSSPAGPPSDLESDPRADPRDLASSVGRAETAPYAREVLEAFPGPALILNTRRQIVSANDAAICAFDASGLRSILGLRPGEAVGCAVAAREPAGCGAGPECRYCGVLHTILRSLASKGRARGEGLLSTTDGGTLNVELAVNCLEVDGEPMLFLGFRDISAEKHREFLQSAFLHDLMNTAGGLQGLLAISREDGAVSTELLPILEDLVQALVDEIEGQRHIMKAEQGSLQPEWAPLDLDRTLEQIAGLYRAHPVARRRQVELRAGTDASLISDGTLVRRVVGNMMKNALEATPEGGRITVVARAREPDLEVEVHNPIAIPPRARAHVFKRGFSTKGGGRGTGTHAMRVLTERYLGGSVSFESDEATGTSFKLRLPQRPPDAGPSADEPPESLVSLGGARVLFADDDEVNRRIGAHLLAKLGARAEVVASGEAAVEAAEGDRFELALLDVEMPGRGGLSAAHALATLAVERRPKIVMLSGHEPPTRRDGSWDAWLLKPIRERDLRRVALLARPPRR